MEFLTRGHFVSHKVELAPSREQAGPGALHAPHRLAHVAARGHQMSPWTKTQRANAASVSLRSAASSRASKVISVTAGSGPISGRVSATAIGGDAT